MRLLVERDADPNAEDDAGTSPLMSVVAGGGAETHALARVLLELGAYLRRPGGDDEEPRTPIDQARENEDAELLAILEAPR